MSAFFFECLRSTNDRFISVEKERKDEILPLFLLIGPQLPFPMKRLSYRPSTLCR